MDNAHGLGAAGSSIIGTSTGRAIVGYRYRTAAELLTISIMRLGESCAIEEVWHDT